MSKPASALGRTVSAAIGRACGSLVKRRCPTYCGTMLIAAVLAASQVQCTFMDAIDAGSVGVTPGGVQDIAKAREEILAGYVPDRNAITVAGFLSEHDIPLTPPADSPEIYASIAVAWRQPFGEPAPGADVFVNLGTTIDLEGFRRRPLNLGVIVDHSGSMADPAAPNDYRPKMDAVREALHSLLGRLTASDRVTLVAFNHNAELVLPPTAADKTAKLTTAIDTLLPWGNTNMYGALKLGFEQVAAAADDAHDSRIILFTDALPNVGPSSSAEFIDLIESYAAQEIGFTLMGVGQWYGTELADDISRVRGGNSFYLSDADRIARVFEDEFDFFVTPAARDLKLDVVIPDGIGIRDVYGVPDYVPGSRGARITVPAFFFSRREGGGPIVIRLTFAETPSFDEPVPLAQMSLSYELPDSTHREMSLELTLPAGLSPSGEPPYFSDTAARRAAVLLDTVLVLQEAVAAYWQQRYDAAIELLEGFLEYHGQATLGLSDRTDPTSRGLQDERELLETLLGTIESYMGYPPIDYMLHIL